jgi:hypothetical protein
MWKWEKITIGERFGYLTVIEETEKRSKYAEIIWKCMCDCGTICEVITGYLRRGKKKSCGCIKKELYDKNIREVSGKRFGRLVAIMPLEKRAAGYVIWQCRCDCGNIVETSITKLRLGRIFSCGCFARDQATARAETSVKAANEYLRSATMETPPRFPDTVTGIRNIYFNKRKSLYVFSIVRHGKRYKRQFKYLEDALVDKENVLNRYKSGDPKWYKKDTYNVLDVR